MRQYHRLMRRRDVNVDTDSERTELFQLLVSAPGTKDVEVLEKHPKGGYRVRFDVSQEALDDFIGYLNNHDWTLAI
jgi:hypothetical protein